MLRLDTEGPVVDRDNYVSATVEVSADSKSLTLAGQVRGRGNSTWEYPKKPYLLKLDEPTSLGELPTNRRWVLLANYSDKTLLRNAIAFCVARMVELPFTPADRFVELTMNGEYVGLYQLTDKVYELRDVIERHRVASGASDPSRESVLLEIDSRYGTAESHDPFGFFSEGGVPYVIDSDSDDAQVDRVAQWVNQLEELLVSDRDASWFDRVQQSLDITSMIDLYLVNELMRNIDGYWASTYVYRDEGGPLRYGPAWDFDRSLGNANYRDGWDPHGWYVRNQDANWYFRELLREPRFVDLVVERWRALHEQLPSLLEHIDEMVRIVTPAIEHNFERWPILNTDVWPNVVVTGSHAGEVDYMATFLTQRAAWIDEHIGELADG